MQNDIDVVKWCIIIWSVYTMNNGKVFQLNFEKVYGLLLDKAVRKGRTKAAVDEVICWLADWIQPGAVGVVPLRRSLLWGLFP